MAFPTSFPFERGANLWGQRSANATVVPSVSRKSTTGCSRKVRPRGVPPISSDHAAAYHAFRKYFAIFFSRIVTVHSRSLPGFHSYRSIRQAPTKISPRRRRSRSRTHTRWSRRKYGAHRSEEHTSELQSLMRTSYAGLCLKKKNT